ncbi:metal-dependent transcriptional regulator [Gordonia sp. FQ]|uniref:metal-dependent transcriptional regulator n=1 Tax=Gordonia sp. FQ TaxID=3446634 RepID=UPI003F856747
MSDVSPSVGAALRTIYNLREDRIPVRRARIRDRLGLAGPTVTQTVGRMVDAGLVRLRDEQYLELTEDGDRVAAALVRRHRLTERLLTDVLKVPAALAHHEAVTWSNALATATERAIVDQLDAPYLSPWGNPIPALDELGVCPPEPGPEPASLAQLGPPGATLPVAVRWISEDAQDDEALVAQLVSAGIVPGAQVRVTVTDGGYELRGLSRIDLPTSLAHVVRLDVMAGR